MMAMLITIVVGATVGAVAWYLFDAWRERREQRRWLEAYAHELGLVPVRGASTPALRRRLAAHLTEPPWRSQ